MKIVIVALKAAQSYTKATALERQAAGKKKQAAISLPFFILHKSARIANDDIDRTRQHDAQIGDAAFLTGRPQFIGLAELVADRADGMQQRNVAKREFNLGRFRRGGVALRRFLRREHAQRNIVAVVD